MRRLLASHHRACLQEAGLHGWFSFNFLDLSRFPPCLQVIIVPIYWNKKQDEKERVLEAAQHAQQVRCACCTHFPGVAVRT